MPDRPKTYVYVDAFNLYYGAVKWLDLSRLFKNLLPNNDIVSIKYFTAIVSPRASDPKQPLRQQVYFRALKTIPHLEIHLGKFMSNIKPMLSADKGGKPHFVNVHVTEEKGSDVNLATHLVRDGFKDKFEVAVVVTNDTDLVEPIKVVRYELKKRVGVINPRNERPSEPLAKVASFIKRIRVGVLQVSQFPHVLNDPKGKITKPTSW